ncbi:MAG: AzlD domain-containing protein [Clostridia bacterium]
MKSFLQYVPLSVLGALTFPDIFYSTGNYKTALCGTIIALFLAYKEKNRPLICSLIGKLT